MTRLYDGKPIQEAPKGTAGFVYLITDRLSNQKYVGRKYFTSIKKVKGKTRRQSSESNRRDYYSSHEWIKITAKIDPDRFIREIICFGKTRGEVNYREVEEQFLRQVLRSDEYLNDNINGKWFKKNVGRYPALS
jgi:hypothetical protein